MQCVLIDDIAQAIALLTPRARRVIEQPLRSAARELAMALRISSWPIISYEEFVGWAAAQIQRDDLVVVLDKLFPVNALRGTSIALDVSRCDDKGFASMPELSLADQAAVRCRSVKFLDDACYRADTVTSVIRQLSIPGDGANSAYFAAISARGTDRLAANGITVRSMVAVPTEWDIQHFRDFFVLLPYSGRRLRADANGHSSLHVRIAPAFFRACEMLQIQDRPDLVSRLRAINLELLDRLEEDHRAPLCASDVGLLGAGVAVPIANVDREISLNTPLRELLLPR
jgi:hypothetical protein